VAVNPVHGSLQTSFQRGIPRHIQAIKSWVEQPRAGRRLQRNLGRWNQLQSALDALRQTHIAVETYNRANGNLSEAERFLAIYGLLQALVVQQDALCHLAEALQTRPVRLNRHRRLVEIRKIRNWTVGHPTKADRHLVASHHAIRRPKLGRGGFALYSAFDDGRTQYSYVPLPQLARLQRRVISRLLRNMLSELHQRNQQQPIVMKKTKPAPTPIQSARGIHRAPNHRNGHHQPMHANGNGNGRANGKNGKGRNRESRPQRQRIPFHPEPRTWLEKTNPPPLLPVRRAARNAAQPIQ
jgi:hypothetical protein